MVTLGLAAFGVFLAALIVVDLLMVISLFRGGDERRQLIVWKASTFTLLVTVGSLILDIAESLVRVEAMTINPFIKLSVTAIVYFLTLLYFRKKHGD